MNKDYWENWYEKKHYSKPTEFVKFAKQYIDVGNFVCELGCGNGRDSHYLGEVGYVVDAFDFACENKDTYKVRFMKEELKQTLQRGYLYDVVYSRFFLHCLTDFEIRKVLKWNKGLFIAEFRCKGDKPTIWNNHKRNFIDGDAFLKTMYKLGYEILYYKKGRDVAKFKNENPLVIRVVARRI